MDQQLDAYYDRMSASLGDKRRVLLDIKGRRVLDVGTGAGELLRHLLSLGYDAYGIDPSPETLERAADPQRIKLGYADEIDQLFGENSFDTIICSSVLHEVFSYGNRAGKIGQLDSTEDALRSIKRALKPGGRLIVRDGVAPNHGGVVFLKVDKPEEVDKFMNATPFKSAWLTDRSINLTYAGSRGFAGSSSSVMEFAFTYTWGPESFEREVQEFYGIFGLREYADFVGYHGFKLLTSYAYTQQGYIDHLAGKVEMSMPFPATNAIWVYEAI